MEAVNKASGFSEAGTLSRPSSVPLAVQQSHLLGQVTVSAESYFLSESVEFGQIVWVARS
jgi:hypothetical protein